jgi:type II secretory pathway component PulK
VAVLVIVVLASMVALSLLFRMRSEEAAFSASLGSEQAWFAAMSGIQQAMALAQAKDPAQWQNNPTVFYHQLVLDDGSDKWYYTIFCPGPPEENQVRYGLVDENGKLNLNKATPRMLQKCTVLSPAQIDGVCGTALASTNSSANAANASGADEPYSENGETNAVAAAAAMAPAAGLESPRPHFSTLDELLKIPGFTPGVIYGEDANHNFHLDPNEDDGEVQFPPDDGDGQLFLGLQDVGTVFSYELNVTSEGQPRLQLNSTNRTIPNLGLPENTVTYIQAAWSNHVIFKTPADLLQAAITNKDSAGKEIVIDSGVSAKELPLVLDRLTTRFEQRLEGLINVNTASQKVLTTIPGVTDAKAEAIIQGRENLSVEQKQTPAWLFSEGILTAAEFKDAASYMSTRSSQFRFNVLGYSLPSGRYRVYEVVIDTADKQPQIIYLRDITKLGLPFALPSGEETQNVQPKA